MPTVSARHEQNAILTGILVSLYGIRWTVKYTPDVPNEIKTLGQDRDTMPTAPSKQCHQRLLRQVV